MRTDKNGFTIIEVTAALFIFSLAALIAVNVIVFSSENFSRLHTRFELRNEAWSAIDFFVTQVELCDEYHAVYRNSGRYFYRINLYTSLTDGAPLHNYIIEYDISGKLLKFGGREYSSSGEVQEYASNITDFTVEIDDSKGLMYVAVKAENQGETVAFEAVADVSHKKNRGE